MKFLYKYSFAILWLFCTQVALASEPIKITIMDRQQNPLPGATVSITNVVDSVAQFSVTDHNGIVNFQARNNTVYVLRATYVGFEAIEQTIMVNSGRRNFELQMDEQALAIEGVTITARRPLIRQQGDKMIIDPEPLVGISTNTLEVLETVPGLFVDQDGGIFINSATPAAIYINGRQQRMGQENLTSLLRSLPPGSIQHIEIIRTPSAQHDASAAGGIINIVLKKGVSLGRFGSINLGMNQGILGNRSAGFTLNEGRNKINFHLNANYNHNALEDNISSSRLLINENSLRQTSITRSQNDNVFVGFGFGYDPNENLNLSFDSRLTGSIPRSAASNANFMQTSDEALLSENNNTIDNHSRTLNLQQNFGVLYRLDTLGSQLNTQLGYSYIAGNMTQNYLTNFIFPGNMLIEGTGKNIHRRHFFDFQSDLTIKLPRNITLETGIKSTLQDFGSDADYYLLDNGNRHEDLLRTNAFNYRENINAAYLQVSGNLPVGLHLRTGIRLEHSRMNGLQTVPSDTSFLINRVDLFPYVFLSRKLMDMAGLELRAFLIYRRSISRPTYQSLNPHIRYLDQFLYETGNPSLRPQFTENFEANITVGEWPILAIGRSYINDIFSGVVYTDRQDSNIAVRTFDNVGKSTETYFRAVVGIPPGSSYFMSAGAQYNINEYEGLYENQPIYFRHGSWRFFTFHSLSVTPDTRITLVGFMINDGMFNFHELQNFGQLNLSLSHFMFDRRLQITLNARDILRTMEMRFALNKGMSPFTGIRYADNQRFGINIRYNFGLGKREEPSQPQMNFEINY